MLDMILIRSNPEQVRRRTAERFNYDATTVDRILELDDKRKACARELDDAYTRRRILTSEITRRRDDMAPLKDDVRALNRRIKELEASLAQHEVELRKGQLALPNLVHISVPIGRDSDENAIVRTWGEPRLPCAAPRPHWDVGRPLGLDSERGVRTAGSRFYLLKGSLAEMELALATFMTNLHTNRHGYTLVIPPYLVHEQAMENCGQLPRFRDGLYHTERDNLYLIPTAESALADLHRDEVLTTDELPMLYVGYTPCFRRESGAAGIDTRGILRVHQFSKVELFKFTTPETSYEELERLVRDAEAVLQALELPYRVVLLCTGDTGFAAAKTYDLDVWLPGQRVYREISSCSNVEDFQARRANTRYRPAPGAKPRFVHMLNGSGLAVGRTMVAILENYQMPDGSVVIPAALRPYMGGREYITPAGNKEAALHA